MKKLGFRSFAIITTLFLPFVLFGLDFDWDDDSLFQDEMIEIQDAEQTDFNVALFAADDVQIGGSINSSVSAFWSWTEQVSTMQEIYDDALHGLGMNLGGDIFVSARPSSDLRLFFKFRTQYPFSRNVEFLIDENEKKTEKIPSIEVFEMFSDFNYNELIYFRVGKQTINWRTGYYWSPVDILSLSPVDLDNPEADLEGPLAIKANIPFQQHNVDLYILGNEAVRSLKDLGLAGRTVLYVAPVQLSLGAAYQRDQPFRLVSSFVWPAGDLQTFGEARLSFGRKEQKISAAEFDQGLTRSEDDGRYVSATAGFQWMPEKHKLAVIGQYLFYGEGYADTELLERLYVLLAPGGDPTLTQMAPALLRHFGQHHSMLVLSLSELGHKNLGASLQWQAAWNDLSGQVSASLTWKLFDRASVNAALHYAYGEANTEFGGMFQEGMPTFRNPYGLFAASLNISLGGGRF